MKSVGRSDMADLLRLLRAFRSRLARLHLRRIDEPFRREQPRDGIGRLRAVAQPLLHLLLVDDYLDRIAARVVVTDDLEETPVTRRACVRDDEPVRRLLSRARTAQTDLDCQVVLLVAELRSAKYTRRASLGLRSTVKVDRSIGRPLHRSTAPFTSCGPDASSADAIARIA